MAADSLLDTAVLPDLTTFFPVDCFCGMLVIAFCEVLSLTTDEACWILSALDLFEAIRSFHSTYSS
jgi:hypothetical protein